MNDLLLRRLKECNISVEDILSKVNKPNSDYTIIMYTSHLENLGTKDSDFDIYVIGQTLPELDFSVDYGFYKVQNLIIRDISLDVEYWTIPRVNNLIDISINNTNIQNLNLDKLKLIHRIRIGEIIFNNKLGEEIKELIKGSKLKSNLLSFYKLQANSYLQDAIVMFNSKEFFCSLNCARHSLESAISALNVKNGTTNVNQKWCAKIFTNNNGYEKHIYDSYIKYQIFSDIHEENFETFLEEMLDFISDLLCNLSVD